MMRFALAGIAVLLIGADLVGISTANAAPQSVIFPNKRGLCFPDYERFCRGVKVGDGRLIACLESHQRQLAPACRNKMAPAFALWDEVRTRRERTAERLKQQATKGVTPSAKKAESQPPDKVAPRKQPASPK